MAEPKRKKSTTSIDDLPEDLLVRILCYIPAIDAVRATLISPKWRNLWHHITRLDFDMSLYNFPSKNFFAGFITRTLLLRPNTTHLKSFRLVFSYDRTIRTPRLIDSWISNAVSSGAAVLRLSFDVHHSDQIAAHPDSFSFARYRFHFSDLNNPCRNEQPISSWDYCSVWFLELVHCRIVWPKNVPADGFLSLIKVVLDDVILNEKALLALVSNCPNLKLLSLWNLTGLRNLKIHSDSLEDLEMVCFRPHPYHAVGSLDICAPNLRTITFDSFCVKKYCSSDLSSLVEADVRFLDATVQEDYQYFGDILQLLSGVESLEKLNLSFNEYILFECNRLKYNNSHCCCSVLVKVKYLELQTGYYEWEVPNIFELLDLCPRLEILVLDSNDHDSDRGLPEEYKSKPPRTFKIPSLKQVEMKRYRGTEKELYVVELLKMHKVVLEKIVAFPLKVNGESPPPILLF